MRRIPSMPIPDCGWRGQAFYTCPDGSVVPIERAIATVSPNLLLMDNMEPEWRALIHEYGDAAGELWSSRVPIFPTMPAMTASKAAEILVQKYGPPLVAKTKRAA